MHDVIANDEELDCSRVFVVAMLSEAFACCNGMPLVFGFICRYFQQT